MQVKQSLSEEIRKRAKKVDDWIDRFFSLSSRELCDASTHLLGAGGKRLRPVTLLLSCESVGGDVKKVLPAAVSVELVHNFTLIHDDIMDEDEMRRGVKTVHTIYGAPIAILAGDTLFSKAFEILPISKSSPDRVARSEYLLARACTEICEGQHFDMTFEKRENVTEAQYMEMVGKKTGALYAASSAIGALLGGGSSAEVNSFERFGRLAGTAFQIHDDVLGLTVPEKVLGKARGSDLLRGKKTLIFIHAKKRGFDAKCKSEGEVEKAISKLHELGSIEYARSKALSMIEQGKNCLRNVRASNAKQTLLELADFMVNRGY